MFEDEDEDVQGVEGVDWKWMNVMGHKWKMPLRKPEPGAAPPSKEEVTKNERRNMATSYGRFYIRLEKFKKAYRWFPRTRHAFWWLVHNFIAHLLLCIPVKLTFRFHDWTSDRLNLRGT